MKKNNPRLFSIILYISNDEYEKTIESIVAQDIGFKENIELIIVPGKSIDAAKYIEGLKSRYPESVVVTKQARGIKEAYNLAQEQISGRYANYADCGSIYGDSLMSSVRDSFDNAGSSVKVVTARCDSEQSDDNSSALINGFPKNDNIVDLKERYRIPFIFFNYCFIDTRVKLDFSFDESIDELFLCRVLFKLFESEPALVLTEEELVIPCHSKNYFGGLFGEYRSNSGLLRAFKQNFLEELLEYYGDKTMPVYVQYNILLFTEWCASEAFAKEVITRVYGEEEFTELLHRVLRRIDDRVITDNRKLNLAGKVFFLELKYKKAAEPVILPNDKKFYFENTRITSVSGNITRVEFVDLQKDRITFHIRVKFFFCDKDKFDMYALVNGKTKIKCRSINRDFDTLCMNKPIYLGMTFEFDVDLSKADKVYSIELYCVHDGCDIKRTNISFEKFTPLSSLVPHCYYYKDGHILSYNKETATIRVEKANAFKAFAKEIRYLVSLLAERNAYAAHAFFARIIYRILKLIHRKPIWLISDRTDRADDNGEAFLKYVNSVNNKKIKHYFVIDKNCDDGKRIAKFAKIIEPNSKKHKFYHLIADYIVSAQAGVPVVNPFQSGNIYYRDILCNMKFVFLQHGVIKDDLSSWLNLYGRNMYGFVVTTHQEYQSILDYNYFYPPKNVWLTGLPRHDFLYHDEQRYITFMPTWRKYLMKPIPDPVTGKWILRDDFSDNEFCRFYDAIFNDERLLSCAKKYGYKLLLKPHPIIDEYADRIFKLNGNVEHLSDDVSYRDVFAKSDLVLTDFSSAVFDFAYLRKPIIYTHFDKSTFFSGGHSYTEGYFDYERDGFGEVTYNLDETVNCIIDYMKNDCEPKQKYLDRINNAFAFNDKDCCKRIYERLVDRSGK